MRHSCTAVAILLIASGVSVAQVPTDWDQWLADGIAAEDNSEYKDAERLFGQACDLSLVPALSSDRITVACLHLSQLYSTQNQLEKASRVAEALVTSLGSDDNSRAIDRVRALSEAASIRAARAYFPEANEQLREAVGLAGKLEPYERATAYADIASFILPADMQALGGDFLRAAAANLDPPDWTNVEFVNAAVKVGSALSWFDRRREALDLLEPAIDAARLRSQGPTEFDSLWQGYRDASRAFGAVLWSRGDKESADKLAQERRTWPSDSQAAFQVGEKVLAPRLQRRADPSYTLGARRAKVQGVVVVSLEIWPDGRAHNIKIVKPLAYGLSWSAIGAIRKWRFEPGTKDGEPVKVAAQVEVSFRLVSR